MSMLFILKGYSSTLWTDFAPLVRLDPNYSYGIAQLSFHSYNGIPNIEDSKQIELIEQQGVSEKSRKVRNTRGNVRDYRHRSIHQEEMKAFEK